MLSRLIPIALAVALAAPAVLQAHPGHDHRLMGTVSAVFSTRITMKTADGQEVRFTVNRETKFVHGRAPGRVSDIKVGLRIIINVGDGIEPLVAKEVRYATTQTTDTE